METLMPKAPAWGEIKCWAGMRGRENITRFSCLTAAFLLLHCRQLASKNTRCCHAVCLLGPGNSSEQLSVQFFVCALVPHFARAHPKLYFWAW